MSTSPGLTVVTETARRAAARLASRALRLLASVLACHLVCAAGEAFCAAARTQPRKAVSVAAARSLPVGTEVTIEGSITSPPGAFKSSKLDDGFALQDRSGGIYVSVKGRTHWRVRERVRVTGKLGDGNGQLMIVPDDARFIEAAGRSQAVRPQVVRTGRVGEGTESRLLKVAGRITRPVVNDPPYGVRLYLDDGTGETVVYISSSAGIELRGLLPGRRLSVTGVGGQYQTHYEVEPRFASDLRLLPPGK